MELARFFGVIRRWLFLIILGTVITAAAAYSVVVTSPQKYRATASIWVTSNGSPGVYTSATDLENFSQTYAQLIPSTLTVGRALTSIGDSTPVDQTLPEVAARAIPRTAIIEISVTDRSAARAQRLANAVAATFISTTPTGETKLAIAAPADLPTISADRRTGLIGVLLATVIGFAIVTALSFVLEYLDDRVRSPAALEDNFGIRFLGAIPRRSSGGPKGKAGWTTDPGSDLADAYRRLRPGLLRGLGTLPTTAIVVAPSTTAIDRGTVILNLAAALGETGARVIVVDADPRHPWLAPRLGMPERIGLVDLIERPDVTASDAIRNLDLPGVSVLPIGKVAGSSSATLSSSRVGAVIREIQAYADIVLIGCAPVVARSDASTLATYVAHAVLLVDSQRERRETIARSEAELRRAGACVAGAILFNVNAGDLDVAYPTHPVPNVVLDPPSGGGQRNGATPPHALAIDHRSNDASAAMVNHHS